LILLWPMSYPLPQPRRRPILLGAILEDQYTGYAFGQQTPILPGTLYEHWIKESAIPAMQQMAYDHLSIPAMSSEIERAFSGAKLNLPASPQPA
jgi:hypothetical protein